eukprot:6205138-Pleurochrysis_carterae.AAC.3
MRHHQLQRVVQRRRVRSSLRHGQRGNQVRVQPPQLVHDDVGPPPPQPRHFVRPAHGDGRHTRGARAARGAAFAPAPRASLRRRNSLEAAALARAPVEA